MVFAFVCFVRDQGLLWNIINIYTHIKFCLLLLSLSPFWLSTYVNGVKERVIRARICPAVLLLPSTVDVVGCKPVALNTVYLWQLLTWGMEPSITKCHGCTQVKPSLWGQPTSSVTSTGIHHCRRGQQVRPHFHSGCSAVFFRLLCEF